ncbi:MAG TPA: thioredoxin [Anaerolineales bacterium]|nr:thioredoxin [Anaerolineales bacterium]
MANIPEVDEASFQNEVLSADQPVLVDFSAVWCGPCRMLDPIVQQLAQDWTGKVKVVKLDVDHNPNIAMQYQVMGVPTLMLFVGGESRERISGYQPKDRILSRLSPHLGMN